MSTHTDDYTTLTSSAASSATISCLLGCWLEPEEAASSLEDVLDWTEPWRWSLEIFFFTGRIRGKCRQEFLWRVPSLIEDKVKSQIALQ